MNKKLKGLKNALKRTKYIRRMIEYLSGLKYSSLVPSNIPEIIKARLGRVALVMHQIRSELSEWIDNSNKFILGLD